MAYVKDLGVEVNPDKWYVVGDSGTFYGGVDKAFNSEDEAIAWTGSKEFEDEFGGDDVVDWDVDQAMKGSDIIATYQTENVMQTVKIKAADGSIGECQVLKIGKNKIKLLHTESGKKYKLTKESFKHALLGEGSTGWCVVNKSGTPISGPHIYYSEAESISLLESNSGCAIKYIDHSPELKTEAKKDEVIDESSHHPSAAIWANQMIRVYDKDTNKQVDQGLVSKVTAESIFIATEEYNREKFEFLVLG
jgi:hypothetical protein